MRGSSPRMTTQQSPPLVLLLHILSGATSEETSLWRESAARCIPPRRAGQSHMSTLHLGGGGEVPLAPYLPWKRGGRRAGPFGRARRVGINARPRRSPPGAQERADLPFSRGGMEQVAHEL